MGFDDVCQQVMVALRDAGLAGLAPHAPCFSLGLQWGTRLCLGGDIHLAACIEPGLYIPGRVVHGSAVPRPS